MAIGLLGLAGVMVCLSVLPKTLPVTKTALMPLHPVDNIAQDIERDAPIPVDLYRFALNAFLVPLLNDNVPPRWTRMPMQFSCEEDTHVLVNGEPMTPAQLIPAQAFAVHWHMDHCVPMGRKSGELSGDVELIVFHEDDGFSAVVAPDQMRVDSHMWRSWLRSPFTAVMQKGTSKQGTTIFNRGDPAENVYLIWRGEVCLQHSKKHVVDGQLLGLTGVFSSEQLRTDSAICLTDVDYGVVTAAKLWELVYQDPSLGNYVLRAIVQRQLVNVEPSQAVHGATH